MESSPFIPWFWLLLGILLFVVIASLSWGQPHPSLALARWSHTLLVSEETPESFYARLYDALGAAFEERPLPLRAVGFGPQYLFATRTILGGRAVYLRLRYDHLNYYIYVSPAPNGVFIASWLFSSHTLRETHPILRWLPVQRLFDQTLFQFDAIELFHDVAHRTLLTVIEERRQSEGLPPLTPLESRPVLRSFYAALKQGDSAQVPVGWPVPPPVNDWSTPSPELPLEALRSKRSGTSVSGRLASDISTSDSAGSGVALGEGSHLQRNTSGGGCPEVAV